VLDGEPGEDIRLFTRVAMTIARGVVIYPRAEFKRGSPPQPAP
jgi:hypothetical protein